MRRTIYPHRDTHLHLANVIHRSHIPYLTTPPSLMLICSAIDGCHGQGTTRCFVAVVAPERPDTVSHLASVRHTTVSMSNPTDRVEIITSVQRRRRWAAAEKVRMVEETFEPGMTVSLVARRRGVAPNQLFTWRRLVVEGALTAAGSGEQVVPASDYRALQSQVRELQRLLG